MKDGTSGFDEMTEETSVKDGTSGFAEMAEEDNGIKAKYHESIPINEKEVCMKEAEPVKPPTEENHDTPSNAEPSKTLIQSRRENEIGTGDNC